MAGRDHEPEFDVRTALLMSGAKIVFERGAWDPTAGLKISDAVSAVPGATRSVFNNI